MISVRDLKKEYETDGATTKALNGISFEIKEGEFVAIMGPSGSGKSTLLHILSFLDRPTGGTYTFLGKSINDLTDIELARIRNQEMGFVFQAFNLLSRATVYENVELPLLLHNYSRKQRHEKVALALDLVGLADRHDHFPRQLSGGQEQRVAIARAIVTDPTIIVADEPTGDLDAEAAMATMALLKRLNTEFKKTMLMVTHDPKTAAVAQQTLHLEKGQLVDEAVHH